MVQFHPTLPTFSIPALVTKMIHTDFKKGTKLFVIRKNGTKFIDKFVEKKRAVIIFKNYNRIKIKDLRSITIYRG